MRTLLPAILVLLLAGHAIAQPVEVTRVLRSFDFEERARGNSEDLPMHWNKVEGDNLPVYVNGKLTDDKAHSGKYAFKIDLDGGSAIYRLDDKQIPVRAGSHYRVSAYAQTTPLRYARARVTAYFTDIDGHQLSATTQHSDLFNSIDGDQDWHELAVELTAPQDGFVVIQLEVLQPILFEPPSANGAKIFAQDIRGSVWWDDVSVSQVPQVTMSTNQPGNVFSRDQLVKLTVKVNDQFTDDLAAQLVVHDSANRIVYQRSGALDMAGAQQTGPQEKTMPLVLPPLPTGWYEAALVMSSQGTYVGQQTLDMIELADDVGAAVPDARFGIDAIDCPPDGWADLPNIVPMLGAGRVKLAVWSDSGDVEHLSPDAFDALLGHLADAHVAATGCLVEPPPELQAKMRHGGWAAMSHAPREWWQPGLAYLVARHANQIDRWQIGADTSDLFATDADARKGFSRVAKEFSALVDKPDLAMPWPAWCQLPAALPPTVALAVPSNVLPAQVPLYLQDLHKMDGHNLSVRLDWLPRDAYGRDVQVRDFAQRVVYALSAGVQRIDLPLPFSVKRENDAIVKQPQELLLAERTLLTTLSGATFKGKVPIADGVEAFLFDRAGQGVVVLWDRGQTSTVKSLAINLGAKPLRVDLWGNVSPLLFSRDDAAGTVRLDVSPQPIILIDIDGKQAQLRASVGFDRPLIESSFKPHTRRIHFTNPYDFAIAGTVKLRPPTGWRIDPAISSFTLNPGESFDHEVSVEFPFNSTAGAKTVFAEFAVQGDSNFKMIVPLTLNLGLSDVGVQTTALRDGADLVVQQMISNYGDQPINYTAWAVLPGQARQERLVTGLTPGKTTIKVYRFPAATVPPGTMVRSGLKEIDGPRLLNDATEVR